jgi:hypothetical protein
VLGDHDDGMMVTEVEQANKYLPKVGDNDVKQVDILWLTKL